MRARQVSAVAAAALLAASAGANAQMSDGSIKISLGRELRSDLVAQRLGMGLCLRPRHASGLQLLDITECIERHSTKMAARIATRKPSEEARYEEMEAHHGS